MKRRNNLLVWLGVFFVLLVSAAGCQRPIATIQLQAVEDIRWEENLLLREGVVLIASSHNLETQRVENLLDDNPNTFWHIDESLAGSPAWVEADFGEEKPVAVSALAVRSRTGYGDQFLRNAQVQASSDGVNWETIAWIRQISRPKDAVWYHYDFDNREPYRFWRLLILDGHIGPRAHFLSIGDLAFFE